ncbi:hypothetical protein Tco_0702015 [Tanacetum coccineum]|uniref:Uncharacterized protein n=1 Tax=Tanacetum coccineum TaxID=301880 RepID=A0ABQ4XUS8_9ASTR
MVAYLQKPEGSEAFHKIVDFLNASHIKYALIENPKIYISLIQQFWGTTTARTTDDGEVEITASIDGQVKTITKASLRRYLKLEDFDGITSLPNTEIFEQLTLIGFPQSQNPTQTQVAYGGLHFTSVDVDTRGAATTDIGLEAVSTAAANLVYIRRSAEKRKDKGKAIMKEDESVQKKTKKQLEQERLGHEEAIRLQEQVNEEENQRIVRDAEIAKQLQEEFNRARQEQEVIAEADQAHDIDWSDLVMLRYHALQNRSLSAAEVRKNMCMYLKNQGGYKHIHFKGMSYEDIRLIFERVWDQNNAFVPKDSKIEKEDECREEKVTRDSKDVVPRDDIAIDFNLLLLNIPIVTVRTHVDRKYDVLSNHRAMEVLKLQIIREKHDYFDRQDVMDLHRLVQERIAIHMMIEKKYPLIQEMLSRMLSRRLEVDQESEMAFEHLRYITSLGEDYWELNSLDLVLPSQSVSTA